MNEDNPYSAPQIQGFYDEDFMHFTGIEMVQLILASFIFIGVVVGLSPLLIVFGLTWILVECVERYSTNVAGFIVLAVSVAATIPVVCVLLVLLFIVNFRRKRKLWQCVRT